MKCSKLQRKTIKIIQKTIKNKRRRRIIGKKIKASKRKRRENRKKMNKTQKRNLNNKQSRNIILLERYTENGFKGRTMMKNTGKGKKRLLMKNLKDSLEELEKKNFLKEGTQYQIPCLMNNIRDCLTALYFDVIRNLMIRINSFSEF